MSFVFGHSPNEVCSCEGRWRPRRRRQTSTWRVFFLSTEIRGGDQRSAPFLHFVECLAVARIFNVLTPELIHGETFIRILVRDVTSVVTWPCWGSRGSGWWPWLAGSAAKDYFYWKNLKAHLPQRSTALLSFVVAFSISHDDDDDDDVTVGKPMLLPFLPSPPR